MNAVPHAFGRRWLARFPLLWLGFSLFLLCSLERLPAQPAVGLFNARPSFSLNNHLVSISVFQWFTASGGQMSGPWQPLEGRSNWTGTTDFWRSQIKQLMAANVDVLYVHLIPDFEAQRVNLFQALNQLRREGWNVPKVAPFLDPMITWNNQPRVDVATAAGKDTFAGQYIRFFNQYYSVNQDPNADDYLARIDGKVVLDTWHVQFNLTNLTSLTRADVQSRLQAAFAPSHPVFTNGIRMVTTALNPPTLSFADEQVPQFEINTYYSQVQWGAIVSAQLKGGYWDQNIRHPGDYLARGGGRYFTNAWSSAVRARSRLTRVYLESWNEFDEGTGMFAANTGTPTIASGNTNTDVWSSSNDPYEYIKTTARGAAQFNDWLNQDAAIVWHNIPTNMMPGETRSATVIVRNEGDALWSEAAHYRFGQSDSDVADFGQRRYLLDDTQEDIPTFGGIFRGRAHAFQITLTAPMQPGIYSLHWGMLQENVAWFGQQLSQTIEVKPLTALANASPANGAAPFAVQFNGQASGGRFYLSPVDTTDDHAGIVTAAGENKGINGNWEVATNAFDNHTGTKWLDFANAYPSTRQTWIQYQYPNNQRRLVTQYTVTSANDAARYPERNPANWRLLGSNNGGASWVTLDVRTNQVFTANYQKLTFGFTNATAFNLYRFQIDRVANPAQAVAMQLDELEFLFEPPTYSYFWSFGDGATSTNQSPTHIYAADGNYTAMLVVSDGLAFATNSITIQAGFPQLHGRFTSTGQYILTWPAWATEFALFNMTNFSFPIVWSLVTNSAVLSGDTYVVEMPLADALGRYFQLQRISRVPAQILVGNVRVQLLSASLVRLEQCGPSGFEDRSTFHVASRNFSGTTYSSNVLSGQVVITASNYVVRLPEAASSLSGIEVDSPSGQVLYHFTGVLTNSIWLPGPEDNPTVAWFADAPRLVPPAWGVSPAPLGSPSADTSGWDLSNDAPDIYVFVPQGNYQQLRRDFLQLTGPTEMVPLFALGAFDSRWFDYSEATALQQIDDYRSHRIPLDVLVNDAGWRAQEYVYQENTSLFPNLPRYFQAAHDRNVHVMFNDHPQAQNEAISALDPAEVQFRSQGLAEFLNQGLDFWWYDRNWSVALPTPAANLRKEVWGMRTYHDLSLAARAASVPVGSAGLRPLIMANVDGIDNGIRNRPPNVVAHRFPFQWTGDIGPDFSYLQGALENCVYSGVQALLPYMSSDLGGFVTDPSVEGYIRWIQFGALSPIYRPHCTMGLSRMPWTFGPQAESVARRFLNLRYRLLPLFYAAARENYETGEPIVRRLDLDYPQYSEARGNDEYLLGHSILVAPVIRAASSTTQLVPSSWLTTPTGATGLLADYFTNNSLAGIPVLSRTNATVNFDWATGSPAAAIPVDNFSIRWTGTIQVPAAKGDLVLATVGDDGVRLWIDGQLVIDAWGAHNSSITETRVPITAGVPHSLQLDYQELTGNAVIRLQWHAPTPPVSRSVWIPPGTWTDAWTGETVAGPLWVFNSCSLDRVPIYLRSGAVIAQAPEMQFTAERPWDPITLDIYPRGDETNQSTLYEDDTRTQAYQQGQFRKTVIAVSADDLNKSVQLDLAAALGTYSLASTQRAWTVRVHRPVTWPTNLAPSVAVTDAGASLPITRLIRNETAMPLGAPNGAPDADSFEIPLPAVPVSHASRLAIHFAEAPSVWSSRDLGSVDREGGATESNGVYRVRGGGADIGGTSDAGHWMYQSLSGDAQIQVRLLGQDSTDPAAKAGLMIRESLSAGAREVFLCQTAAAGLSLQWRTNLNGASFSQGNGEMGLPTWLRLQRIGTSLNGFYSTNGLDWLPVGGVELTGLTESAYWGFAVTAHNNSTNSVAMLDSLTVHSAVSISAIPDQWSVVGMPLPPLPFTIGSANVSPDMLQVSADSTNQALLPPGSIVLSGSGSNRWVTLHPAAGVVATNQVSVKVTEGVYSAVSQFLLTVYPPPQLGLTPTAAGNGVVIAWPWYGGKMQLLTTADLAPSAQWWPVTNAIMGTNLDTVTVTLLNSGTTRFFRLAAQPE